MSTAPQIAADLCRWTWRSLRAASHTLALTVVLMMNLACVEGKFSQAGEENGAEEAAVLMHCSQPSHLLTERSEKLVDTSHGHSQCHRAVASMSQVENSFDEGHRLANGLIAPLRT